MKKKNAPKGALNEQTELYQAVRPFTTMASFVSSGNLNPTSFMPELPHPSIFSFSAFSHFSFLTNYSQQISKVLIDIAGLKAKFDNAVICYTSSNRQSMLIYHFLDAFDELHDELLENIKKYGRPDRLEKLTQAAALCFVVKRLIHKKEITLFSYSFEG